MNEPRLGEAGSLRMRSHCVHMDDRAVLSITGVSDVGSFNDREVLLSTEDGAMCVEGNELHIAKLDLNEGCAVIEGAISAIVYEDEPPAKRGSLFSRMFR